MNKAFDIVYIHTLTQKIHQANNPHTLLKLIANYTQNSTDTQTTHTNNMGKQRETKGTKGNEGKQREAIRVTVHNIHHTPHLHDETHILPIKEHLHTRITDMTKITTPYRTDCTTWQHPDSRNKTFANIYYTTEINTNTINNRFRIYS